MGPDHEAPSGIEPNGAVTTIGEHMSDIHFNNVKCEHALAMQQRAQRDASLAKEWRVLTTAPALAQFTRASRCVEFFSHSIIYCHLYYVYQFCLSFCDPAFLPTPYCHTYRGADAHSRHELPRLSE